MRALILALIASLLLTPALSAATVSGEIGSTPTTTKTQIQYQTGIRGTCYTMIKNQKTGKMIKRNVLKKYCIKK
jgi:hypothetical protein